uniref:Uncharacterized protein n=1 Tax=Oryza rufipogon TaxID=4529 RepID=A0A0E0NE98_ORYRU
MAGVGGRFGTATASALRSTAIRFLPRGGSRDYENPYPVRGWSGDGGGRRGTRLAAGAGFAQGLQRGCRDSYGEPGAVGLALSLRASALAGGGGSGLARRAARPALPGAASAVQTRVRGLCRRRQRHRLCAGRRQRRKAASVWLGRHRAEGHGVGLATAAAVVGAWAWQGIGRDGVGFMQPWHSGIRGQRVAQCRVASLLGQREGERESKRAAAPAGADLQC